MGKLFFAKKKEKVDIAEEDVMEFPQLKALPYIPTRALEKRKREEAMREKYGFSLPKRIVTTNAK